MDFNQIYNVDALEGLKQLDENSIDAIVSATPARQHCLNLQKRKEI